MNLWLCRTPAGEAFLILSFAVLSFAQNNPAPAGTSRPPKHFDHVLVIVLENQDFDSAMTNDLLKSLAQKGAVFTNFHNLYHYSYPNYLAMIAGSDFGIHRPQVLSDRQRTFPDDAEHRTIADLLS